jgi:hypothetical protein
MLLGMLRRGWFQTSQQDIENSRHIFTRDVLKGWCLGWCGVEQGRIADGIFRLVTEVFSVSHIYTSQHITSKDERSKEGKHSSSVSLWNRQASTRTDATVLSNF